MDNSRDENLLSAWLCLCSRVKNDRFVKGMSFSEIFVCNILYKLKDGETVSATDIVEKTGMLKSQVNRVLSSLEQKEMIIRRFCMEDRRKIEVMLTKEGALIYLEEHKRVLLFMQKLCNKLGDAEADNAIETLYKLSEAVKEIG